MGQNDRTDQLTNPLGDPALEDSYRRYLDWLKPCPGCGRVDEMDNIEGRLLCAACSLDEHDADEWDEWGDDEELRT